MPSKITTNRIGQVFNELTVLEEVERKFTEQRPSGRRRFLCRCSCGVEKIIQIDNLVSGTVQSCGHLWQEKQPASEYCLGEDEWKTIPQWAKDPRCVVVANTVRQRIRKGWSLEAALTTPRPQKAPKPSYTWRTPRRKGVIYD